MEVMEELRWMSTLADTRFTSVEKKTNTIEYGAGFLMHKDKPLWVANTSRSTCNQLLSVSPKSVTTYNVGVM